MSRLLDKLAAILRRDLLTALRYGRASWLYGLGGLAELAAFYYLARAIGPDFRPDGVGYFAFLLIGTGFYGFFVAGIASFVNGVHQAQVTGTWEVLMTTSTRESQVVTMTALSTFFGRTIHLLLYLAAGALFFGAALTGANLPGALAVFALSLLVSVSIGIMAAAMQVALQRGGGIVWLASSLLWLLTGATFPISALPRPLEQVASWIPVTQAIDGLRLSLLRGAGFHELAVPLLGLALWGAILLPASLLLFSRALRYARLRGSLSFY